MGSPFLASFLPSGNGLLRASGNSKARESHPGTAKVRRRAIPLALSTSSVEIQLELVGGDSPDFEFLLDTQ